MSSRVKEAVLVAALSCAYAFGLFILFGHFNAVEFPWQPYAGKSRSAIAFLVKVPDAVAIVVAASLFGTLVVLSRQPRPLLVAVLLSVPAAVFHAATSPFIGLQSGFGVFWLAEDVVLIVAVPVMVVWLELLISNLRFKRTAL